MPHEEDPFPFDLKQALEWYQAAYDLIAGPFASTTHCPYPIEHDPPLKSQELAALISLVPSQARERSILTRIIGADPLWHHRDSRFDAIQITGDAREAVSPTAFIPSVVRYDGWRGNDGGKHPQCTIWLHRFPKDMLEKNGVWIASCWAFLRSYFVSICIEAGYTEPYVLRYQDGTTATGAKIVHQFQKLAERHLPVSYYEAALRWREGRFMQDSRGSTADAVCEALAESATAMLMKFVVCAGEPRRRRPMSDRPEVEIWLRRFLLATRVR